MIGEEGGGVGGAVEVLVADLGVTGELATKVEAEAFATAVLMAAGRGLFAEREL